MKRYLALVQVGNELQLDDLIKIYFAATFLSGTAAAWWYTRVRSNIVPNSRNDLEAVLIQEFVPLDSFQRSRDKLRNLFQRTSVSSYLFEFRNIVFTITGMSEVEQVDRFCQGLKLNVRLAVLNAGVQSINEASRITLNVDSALFGAGMYHACSKEASGPTLLEIGNFEQRKRDRERNACFKCHKVGCRPYKCANKSPQKLIIGNTSVSSGSESTSSQAEN